MLAALYFLYFAAAGVSVTFMPYHMKALGLTDGDIGVVFGVRTVIAIAAQLGLAAWSARLRRPWALLVALLGMSAATAAGMPWLASGQALALLIWAQTPAQANTVPIIDALVVNAAGGSRRYGRARVWGSVGYGAAVGSFGLLTDRLSHEEAGALSLPTFAVISALALVVGLPLLLRRPEAALPDRTIRAPAERRVALGVFFGAAGLHWAAITIFNVFFPLYTQELELGNAVPGLAVLAAVAAEALAFLVAGRLLAWRSPAWWLTPVCLLGAARWVVTAASDDPALLIGVQVLHALSFGVWLSATMELLGRFAGPGQRGGLQALFFAAVFGGGGILGTLGGGALMEVGGGQAAFAAAAAAELAAWGAFVATRRWWDKH